MSRDPISFKPGSNQQSPIPTDALTDGGYSICGQTFTPLRQTDTPPVYQPPYSPTFFAGKNLTTLALGDTKGSSPTCLSHFEAIRVNETRVLLPRNQAFTCDLPFGQHRPTIRHLRIADWGSNPEDPMLFCSTTYEQRIMVGGVHDLSSLFAKPSVENRRCHGASPIEPEAVLAERVREGLAYPRRALAF